MPGIRTYLCLETSLTTTLAPAPPAAPAEKTALAPSGGLRRRLALRLLALAVLYLLWEVTARVMKNPTFIPSPGAVWDQLITTSTTHDGVRGYSGHLLIEHLGVSLRRILIGSIIGVAGGLLIGVLLGTVSWLRVVAEPVITFVRALPPVAVATAAAVHNAPTGLVEAARALGAGRWQSIRDVVLPNALPEIFTGIRLAVGVAYSSVVAAETINGVPGIGGMIRDAQRYSQTDVVVLGLFAIGLSGLLIDALLLTAENKLIPWRGRA
jgi:taurine transport system permease protein